MIFEPKLSFSAEDMIGAHMPDVIRAAVEKYGDAQAVSCVLPTGHVAGYSYLALDEMTDAIAAFLREDLGLRRGDVVAIQAPNILSYPVVAFGILKAGVTVTNINPLYTVDETNHQLKDSGAKALFVIDVFGDRVAASVEGTAVQHIYKLSVTDLYPAVTRALISTVMKLQKKVPQFSGKADGTFAQVLKRGRALMKKGVDSASYIKNLSSDDIAFYQYTGGTTGRSKGARLSHGNVVANISQGYKVNEGVRPPGEYNMMLLLPLYHVYALAAGFMMSIYNGTHVVLVPAPRPLSNLKPVFDKFDVHLMPGINTLYIGLMNEDWFVKNPPNKFLHCFSGAAPLQPETVRKWKELTGAEIYEGYGLTESTCAVSTMPLDETPKRGSCGRPLPGTQIRIVGEDGKDAGYDKPGELWVRGPQVMQGYLNRPDATVETLDDEGWLKTGDIAVFTEDGWLSIVDRKKDMIIVSGFNVFPTDIEDVLTKHDDIMDAAVVGVPSDATGEMVVAYVVLADSEKAKQLSQKDVMSYCRDSLTGYKVPRVVEFIDELPKSPIGKVLRRELRDQAVEAFGEK